jgi:hypothetical protein
MNEDAVNETYEDAFVLLVPHGPVFLVFVGHEVVKTPLLKTTLFKEDEVVVAFVVLLYGDERSKGRLSLPIIVDGLKVRVNLATVNHVFVSRKTNVLQLHLLPPIPAGAGIIGDERRLGDL